MHFMRNECMRSVTMDMETDADPHTYKETQKLLHAWKRGVAVDEDKVQKDWAYHNVLMHSPLAKAAGLAELRN